MDTERYAVRIENFAHLPRRCAFLNNHFGIWYTTASNQIIAYENVDNDDEMGGKFCSYSIILITCIVTRHLCTDLRFAF